MSDESLKPLTEETAHSLLGILAKGSTLLKIETAPGSFSNTTEIVDARLSNGDVSRFAVRRYKVFGDYDRGEKAQREFKTFELLNRHKIPAPKALYLDQKGEVLGSPGIVTRFVEGRLIMDAPSEPMDWARKLAQTLARIHSIPCGAEEQAFLLKGNAEVSWFLNHDAPPHYMQEYPKGSDVWWILYELSQKIQKDTPVLLHLDYWTGNILWDRNEIAAVIDWEEAAYGDPGVDVAYARMNMLMMGFPDAADEFIRAYELETGYAPKNMGFWELAASVRPMIDPIDWKINGPDGESTTAFLKFIDDALKKL